MIDVIGKGFRCWLHRKMFKILKPSYTVACSDVLRDRLVGLGVDPVTTIGNPIDVDRFKSDEEVRYQVRH